MALISTWIQLWAWVCAAFSLAGASTESPISQRATPSIHSSSHQSFKSTNVTAPVLNVKKSGKPLAKGLLVFAPLATGKTRPLLMTDDGDLVWSGPTAYDVTNLFVQTLYGKPVLSRWTGEQIGDVSYGKITILDTTYSEIHVICAKLGLFVPSADSTPECQSDIHESLITARNTILVTANNITQADLRSVGGPKDGWVVDSQFYEIDIKTNKILFKWSSIEHVPVSKSIVPREGKGKTKLHPYDYFHINAVQVLDLGYLVNSRFTSTIYHISSTGHIAWKFSGQDGGDFAPMPDFGHFNYQHDARHAGSTETGVTVHIFNNDNFENDNVEQKNGVHPSTGLEFHLDLAKNSSTLLRRLHDPAQLFYSTSEGDYFPLPNGNILVAYGEVTAIKEFGPNGNTDVRMTVEYGNNYFGSYRAYRQEWHAIPASKPDVAVHAKDRKGWVSWNGATDVTRYVLYTGAKQGSLVKAGEVKKSGFETEFRLPDSAKKGHFLQIGAFDGQKLLRKSKVIKVA